MGSQELDDQETEQQQQWGQREGSNLNKFPHACGGADVNQQPQEQRCSTPSQSQTSRQYAAGASAPDPQRAQGNSNGVVAIDSRGFQQHTVKQLLFMFT